MKNIWLVLGIVLLLGAGGYMGYSYFFPENTTSIPDNSGIAETPALDELPELTPQTTATGAAVSTPKPTQEKVIIATENTTPGNDTADNFIRQGKDFLAAGKFIEAREAFAKANQSDPITVYYLGLMGSYFGERQASENYLKSLGTLPNSDVKLTQNAQKVLDAYTVFDTYQDGRQEFLAALVAKQFLVIGEIDLAIGKMEYVLSKVPNYIDVSTLLGSAYLIKGNYEKAISIFTKSLPNDRPEVYYWLGIAHFYQQNYNKAIGSFQLALNKGYKPQFKPHEKMADSYVALANFEQAVVEYEAAINTTDGSKYIDLYIRPVWVLIDKLRDPNRALAMANQAVLKHPDSAMAYNLLGWSYVVLGNYEQGKIALDRALSLDATLAAVHLNMGNYYRAQNNLVQAKSSYEQAILYDKSGSIARAARNLLKSIEGEVQIQGAAQSGSVVSGNI
ncbi:MAG: hypothetical protein A2V81_04130 [Candidatus Abawacabacteria bacterium RBG_16_42_10]|uniref:Tetratricopeptide repeat protein n=1 Tax=Candidatus Abawacabacteria bacterium RBG_16_42_10 TaxID=1817814 RepID=A0A1F4XI58_9BACT|nr:MAG: hypothetical protein A2V81_04130 [Candidatus Abawacabacteria bacterium RBG_16_42_10]